MTLTAFLAFVLLMYGVRVVVRPEIAVLPGTIRFAYAAEMVYPWACAEAELLTSSGRAPVVYTAGAVRIRWPDAECPVSRIVDAILHERAHQACWVWWHDNSEECAVRLARPE